MAELKRYDWAIQRLLEALSWYPDRVLKRVDDPKPGDVLMLSAAPQSEWHLSFYVERTVRGEHLLESVKTGKLCRWSNVGLMVIDCEKANLSYKIRWTDAQFEFERKFNRVRRTQDFYINIPYIDSFDGDSVRLGFRTRHDWDKTRTTVAAFPYLKVTQRRLAEILMVAEKEHEQARESAKLAGAARAATGGEG